MFERKRSMKNRLYILLAIGILSLSSVANAAFQLDSRSGTAADNEILGSEVTLEYQTDSGTQKTATDNVSVITVNAIYGYNPSWADVPTMGIEPGEVSTFSYQIMNVGNHSDVFSVTYSAKYYLSDSTSWNITVSTTSIMLSPDTASPVFDLVITSSAQVTPGAYVSVSLNIKCDSDLAAVPYTGDNGFVYGGFGNQSQVVTATVLIAIVNLTKTVTVNVPAGYTGSLPAVVPGAKLTYRLDWGNTGSLYAKNVEIIDILPTLNTTLTGNAVVYSSQASAPILSYFWNNVWNLTPAYNAAKIRVQYNTIPANSTGNITYNLIIK
ncbi:MAG TPA: hypothetical protein DF296_02930 [Candidatus Margulisbacteria bacterium]|nr:hypothetical protein [Candidatus Margulisiibacteriota bacterium]HCT84134.1 hypothetical protein [Candidatus Margulisiibacteriota bacterium]